MSRHLATYAAPMTPVTPVWAGAHDPRTMQGQRLLPSAIEMTTPPQTVPRKLPNMAAGSTMGQGSGPQGMMTAAASPIDPQRQVPSQLVPNTMESGPLYRTADMQGVYPPGPPMSAPSGLGGYASNAEMGQFFTPQMGMPQLMPNSYPQQQFQQQGFQQQPAYPSIRNSYAQYYQDGMMPSLPPATRSNSGRVSKMPRSSSHSRLNNEALASRNAVGLRDEPSTSKSEYASKIQDRYSAYNHYILRHSADEKSKVIWSADVEAVFMEAVWLIPGESCKILMDRRVRGRNELISDYLKHELGETRSRKQVSSHLQVLKKLLRNDQEFLEYVGPKKTEDGIPSELGDKEAASKSRSDMSFTSLEQLIDELKKAKQNQPKPAFLIQALANLQQSRNENMKFAHGESMPSQLPEKRSFSRELLQRQPLNIPSSMHMPAAVQAPSSATVSAPGMMIPAAQVARISTEQVNMQPDLKPTNSIPNLMPTPSLPAYRAEAHPPLRHPKPVHAQDLGLHNIETIIAPSASVPPKEAIELTASPRRHNPHLVPHHSRHHRRTTSTSVDLSGDRVLPVQFRMSRTTETGQFVYSRLLRATYESPLHPLQLHHLTAKFPDLDQLKSENKLAGAQVVHANVALHVKNVEGLDTQLAREQYSSDVQFVVTCDEPTSSPLHRYIARTVVTSRETELLRCEIPCLFQRLAGRGLEQDKEVVNVPFLPDFWSDFLVRLNNSDFEYIQAALSALTMYQAIYRVQNGQEEVCFVSLYQFSAASDEFSARTRFRRVKGVPRANSSSSSVGASKESSSKPDTPTKPGNVALVVDEPSTPTRSSRTLSAQQTPKPVGTPALLGIGTPGQALSSLGSLMSYESPVMYASPRRLTAFDNIELGASPFTAVISNEARGSPKSPKFEIQRAMTAFEPSAWDEMHDWIYQ